MAIPITHRPPAVPKRVILFGLLLGASLAVLGLVGSRLVASLNSSYQEIVSTQLPSLSLIREISKAQASSRRLIEAMPLRVSDADVSLARTGILRIRGENDKRLIELEQLLSNDTATQLISSLRAARVNYHKESDRYLDVIAKHPDKTMQEVLRATLIDADIQYVLTQNQLAEYCEQSATAGSYELTSRSEGLNRFFFIVAVWPLVLAIGFFVYGLISTTTLFYKSRTRM